MGRKKSASSRAEPTGLILHVGAGRCSELASYTAAKPRRILLIEPQPDRARWLQQRTRNHADVEVMPVAVDGTGSSDGKLKVFNLRDYSSLRTPTGLHELFPGLRPAKELDVGTIDITNLVERESLPKDERHWLVIDAPGEEADIVAALARADMLTSFQRIDLYCGLTSHYEGGQSDSEILEQLAAYGYEAEASDAESDPDRPRWITRLSPLKLENMALGTKVQELVEEREKFKDELAQLKKDQNRKLAERQQEIQRIQADDAERREREERMQEEIARAEAQIDLIKELVLREESQ